MSRAWVVETERDISRIFERNPVACPEATIPGSDLLGEVETFIRRYVVLPETVYLALTVWVVATYLSDSFDCFPYLALISPTKRCGKTRLLEILELLSHNAWRGTTPSPAALYRMMASEPTLLLDEIEGLNKRSTSEVQQAILAILNAGHRRGATIPRCEGPRHELRQFPVYGPKAFAAIGKLPDTLLDRSIVITMQRRLPDQKVQRFLWSKAKTEAEPITQNLEIFATGNTDAVRRAYQQLTTTDLGWLSDRDADLWMPLYAVYSIAAPLQLSKLEDASRNLCVSKTEEDEDDSIALKLLVDIRHIWPDAEEHCETRVLIEGLHKLEESPWGTEPKLTPRKLAQHLKPFGVRPSVFRDGERGGLRGYSLVSLGSAFSRYLQLPTVTSATSVGEHYLRAI